MLLRGVNLFLVGMMGAGKSTVGKLLAPQLQYRFVDMDNLIEACAQRSIADIFRTEGEAYFRELESQVLQEVCAHSRLVVATGGGSSDGRPQLVLSPSWRGGLAGCARV